MQAPEQNRSLTPFFCVMALYYLASNFVHPVTPTLIVERGLDSALFGLALAAMMTTNFLFAPLWGRLCGYLPTRRILCAGCLGYAAGQVLFAEDGLLMDFAVIQNAGLVRSSHMASQPGGGILGAHAPVGDEQLGNLFVRGHFLGVSGGTLLGA